jgi:hypothetical protein
MGWPDDTGSEGRLTRDGYVVLHDVVGYAPVLITDVAEFAFFSRLGWLVEYVPKLSAPAEAYAARKLRYLARLLVQRGGVFNPRKPRRPGPLGFLFLCVPSQSISHSQIRIRQRGRAPH